MKLVLDELLLVERGWLLVEHELLVERELLVEHEFLEQQWIHVVVAVERMFQMMVGFCRLVFVGMGSSWHLFLELLAFQLVPGFLGRRRDQRFLEFLVLLVVTPLRPFRALQVVLEVLALSTILALLAVQL
ncbi:hypothetical protein EI009_25215, partial [Escherichia coli]|nr:hypothetical protein [Escherichia coli]